MKATTTYTCHDNMCSDISYKTPILNISFLNLKLVLCIRMGTAYEEFKLLILDLC
jgi:hypothetical protein